MKPSITIKVGALHDTVTVDGVTFDRSKMTGPEKRKLSRMIRSALENTSYFGGARA
jgi:hypothetical protein